MFNNIINSNLFNKNNLNSYIYMVNSLPVLSLEKEHKLITRFYYYGDLESIKELILLNLRFVIYITKNYSGYGLSRLDLIQEGNIGLMKSIKKFNPFFGVRLISFAIHWIKAEIHNYILKNWRIVKIATTKSQRKLFFNLRKIKKKMGWFNNKEIKFISSKLNVSKKDIIEMESRMFNKDIEIDFNINNFNKNKFLNILGDKNSNFANNIEIYNWKKYIFKKLKFSLNILDNRSKYIIISRWLNNKKKKTLKKLAEYYSVSAERIRQIEKNAMKKIKIFLKNKSNF